MTTVTGALNVGRRHEEWRTFLCSTVYIWIFMQWKLHTKCSLIFYTKQRACPTGKGVYAFLMLLLAAPRTCLSDQHAPRPAYLAPTFFLSDCYYLQLSTLIVLIVVLSVHDNNNLLFNTLATVNQYWLSECTVNVQPQPWKTKTIILLLVLPMNHPSLPRGLTTSPTTLIVCRWRQLRPVVLYSRRPLRPLLALQVRRRVECAMSPRRPLPP